jgi:putative ATPase
MHLKDTHQDRQALGHGEGYLYPHDYPDHYVAQAYWPDPVRLYEPTTLGYEAEIRQRLELWRSRPKPPSEKTISAAGTSSPQP